MTDAENLCQSGVFTLTSSDHFCVYAIINSKKIKYESKIVEFRNMRRIDYVPVNKKLEETEWDEILEPQNNDLKLDSIEATLLKQLNKVAPLRKKRVKGKNIPWYTPGLFSAIALRNTLYDEFRKNPCSKNHKKQRNYVSNQLKRKKNIYFSNKFKGVIESKPLWNIIREMINKGEEKPHISVLKNSVNNSIKYIVKNSINNILVKDSEIAEELYRNFIVSANGKPFNRALFEYELVNDDKTNQAGQESNAMLNT